MNRERWTPARYIAVDQVCDFCWAVIPRARPGNKAGTRGTKAWFNPDRKVWE
ncbi:MAG TPA: hypothetical protein VIV56_07185 [Gemmatimonadales bacterium]